MHSARLFHDHSGQCHAEAEAKLHHRPAHHMEHEERYCLEKMPAFRRYFFHHIGNPVHRGRVCGPRRRMPVLDAGNHLRGRGSLHILFLQSGPAPAG